ncbi:MAG: peptide chain release factor 1 [Bacteroidales bacterium]|nr:peptide chain release factor 1 [Bacteroidales bacterium]
MKNSLILDKLEDVKKRFDEINRTISSPDAMSDMKKFVKLNKEYKELQPLIEAYSNYKNILSNLNNAKDMLANEKDEEMREMAKVEIDDLSEKIEPLEEEIKILLLPTDPQDEKNAVLEIRAGTGGDEASIFAGDLYRMYTRYIEKMGWKMEITDFTEGTAGGYKEIILNVKGNGVYGILKYESGVHRVQRVPQTETQGRVHTSAASVAVLPEADEVDIQIKQEDVRIDRFCSSGPGGQSVNTTYSAVRLTHIPTGVVVQCQDQKSQLKNLDKAMNELRTRLYNLEYQKYLDEIASKRRTMVSTGDRSAKIRTYNYPQSRLTDHRINLTMYNLPNILDGNIDEILDKLQMAENVERLKASGLN